jgi:acyl-CoA reductase-like NAD-dependent aldehyde dehydrogenase
VPAFTMTIGGEAVSAAETFDVLNPATGKPTGQAPDCSQAQLDRAFAGAQHAQRAWRQDSDARRDALIAGSKALEAAADQIAALLTAEQGKPLADAREEVGAAAGMLAYYARLELPREIIQDDDGATVEVFRRPLGVVAAITPWNFPLALAAMKIAPALLAGNTMVLKPSPYTPLNTLLLGEVMRDVLPPGVLNVVSGGDQLGIWMTRHPTPRKISFTGSVATGKHVAASAAPDLKRITLELGGNDPAIVLDDIDLEQAADGLFWGAFANNGQICAAIKRLYVPEQLHNDLVDLLAERARSVQVGDGTAPGTQLGPISNRPQFERVSELVAAALSRGATAAAGGKAMDSDGFFFEPTVLVGAREGTRIVDEEQFGPALPVIPYSEIDEVIERANATSFGLSGSVWSADPDRAASVAAQLECGTAWINTHLGLSPRQPTGGVKWSGIGVENGPWGYYGMTEIQVMHRRKRR